MPHSQELHSQVRALAWQLSRGEVSWAEYRERRRAEVHAIVRDGAAIKYEKPVIRDDPTAPKDRDIEQVYIDMDALEGERPSRLPAYIAVAALVLLLAVLATVSWLNHQLEVQQAQRAAAPPVVALPPGEALLQRFHRDDDWSIPQMEATLASWRELDPATRDAARRSASWRRLQTTLRSRLNEAEVRMQVDDSGAAEQLRDALVAFRDALEQ